MTQKKNRIAVVLPTIRPEGHAAFVTRWKDQFEKHEAELITVWDGKEPTVEFRGVKTKHTDLEGHELVANHCAGVRNLGFLYIAQKLKWVDIIITLDDDMSPDGDTIGDHLKALDKRLPIQWFSHTGEAYMRGFPYQVRQEAPVMLSHGVWQKNPDLDAPTELVLGNDPDVSFWKGALPRGIHAPICGMNVAFRREALPHVYYAPVSDFPGAERFDDIWGLLYTKKDFDSLGWAIATGYASSIHERASNVLYNLEKEAVGIRHNEELWKDLHGYSEDEWFVGFRKKREKWYNICKKYATS